MNRYVMLKRPRTRWLIVTGAVAGAVLIGGVAYAAIPDSSGVIHGCYVTSGKKHGQLSVTQTTCRAGTTPLNWRAGGGSGTFAVDVTQTLSENQPTGQRVGQDVHCPAGYAAVGGGYSIGNPPDEDWVPVTNQPLGPVNVTNMISTGWDVQIQLFGPNNGTEDSMFFDAYVLCAPLGA
jgi:hypothetical protein